MMLIYPQEKVEEVAAIIDALAWDDRQKIKEYFMWLSESIGVNRALTAELKRSAEALKAENRELRERCGEEG